MKIYNVKLKDSDGDTLECAAIAEDTNDATNKVRDYLLSEFGRGIDRVIRVSVLLDEKDDVVVLSGLE